MKNRINRKYKIHYSFPALAMLVSACLISCTPSTNNTKQKPVQSNQVEKNNVNTESPSLATPEKTGQMQNEDNQEIVLNPPHGQPGHRCEIPVGSPLNAPAVKSVPESTANETKVSAPTLSTNPMAPTLQNANRTNPSQARSTAAPETGPKPANNPPHGQPWHRCDIAVGSPLP
jgi:hypothetical protein